MNEKRYYWLKLEENYFDLKVQKALRKLPSGAEMLVCYLKMQLKYLKTKGIIEFNNICESIAEEIAIDIDEEIDIVKLTLSILSRWNILEEMKDGIYIKEMQQRLGTKSDVAIRVEKHRKNKELLQCNTDVTKCNYIQEIDIEKDIDIDIKSSKVFKKPTLTQLQEFITDNKLNVDPNSFIDYYESNGWQVGKVKMKDWKAAARNWSRKDFNKKENVPEWFNKEITKEQMTEDELKEIERSLSEFK